MSIIDWSIEWGLNERREQNDKNKFRRCANSLKYFQVFREENVPVKFKSNLIEQFEQVFDDLGAAQLSKHFAYATDYEFTQ